MASGAKICDPANAAEGLRGGERSATSVLVERRAASGFGGRCPGPGLGGRRVASGLGGRRAASGLGRCAVSGLGGNA